MTDRLEQALQRIDELNAEDPNSVTVDSEEQPRELAYAGWMTRWVQYLDRLRSEMTLRGYGV